MNRLALSSSQFTPVPSIVGLISCLPLIAVFGMKLLAVGITFSQIDALGVFNVFTFLLFIVALRRSSRRSLSSNPQALLSALYITATVLMLSQFLGTFDPYHGQGPLRFKLIWLGELLVSTCAVFTLKGWQFFALPTWLWATAIVAVVFWITSDACSSCLRALYGELYEIPFPDGSTRRVRLTDTPAPQVDLQLIANLLALPLVVTGFLLGRVRYLRNRSKEAIESAAMQPHIQFDDKPSKTSSSAAQSPEALSPTWTPQPVTDPNAIDLEEAWLKFKSFFSGSKR